MASTLLASSFVVISAAPSRALSLPLLRVGNATVIEGDAGSEVVRVPVDLSAPAGVKVTAQYAIQGGSATAGSDFAARTGKVTFGANVAHMNISVIVFGDTTIEPNDTIDVHVSSAVNATIDQGDGTVTIIDDDANPQAGIRASIGTIVVTRAEAGAHTAQIPITLSQPAPSPIRIHYTMQCGTVNGQQLEAFQGTITFQTGDKTKYLTFKVPNDGNLAGAIDLINTLTVLSGPVAIDQGRSDSMILDPDNPPIGTVTQQSVDSDGNEAAFASQGVCSGPGYSGDESLSADGRYVAFRSSADNLVPGDTNGMSDAFVHDNVTGITERVSVGSDGSQALYNRSGSPDNTFYVSISPDGRYVMFMMYRPPNGIPTDTGGGFYVHDRQTGTTTRLVAGPSTAFGSMSADDRYVVFQSDVQLTPDDQDVLPDPTNTLPWGTNDVFRYDRVTATFELVTKSYDGAGAWGDRPSISADGRYVSFRSNSPDIVPGDTNACTDEFVRDMATGITQQVDVTSGGQPRVPSPYEAANGCTSFFDNVMLSPNGQYAAFSSPAWNLVPGATTPPTGPTYDSFVYVRDLVNQTTEFIGPQSPIGASPAQASGMSFLTGISGDGRFVSYTANRDASTIVTTYLYDRQTGDVTEVGQLPDGTIPNDDTWGQEFGFWSPNDISADGHYIVFESLASNLVDNDNNNASDVFRQLIS